MDHESDISLINSHTKGNGGDDDLSKVGHPVPLDLTTPGIRHICVVMLASDPVVLLQVFGEYLTIFPGQAVDNSALILKASLQLLDEILIDVLDILLVSDFKVQIGSIEATLEIEHFLLNVENSSYVILDFLSRSGGQTENWHSLELLLEHAQFEIVLSEVLAPLRNAVHLINDEEVDLVLLVELCENLLEGCALCEHLRRHVHDLEP